MGNFFNIRNKSWMFRIILSCGSGVIHFESLIVWNKSGHKKYEFVLILYLFLNVTSFKNRNRWEIFIFYHVYYTKLPGARVHLYPNIINIHKRTTTIDFYINKTRNFFRVLFSYRSYRNSVV